MVWLFHQGVSFCDAVKGHWSSVGGGPRISPERSAVVESAGIQGVLEKLSGGGGRRRGHGPCDSSEWSIVAGYISGPSEEEPLWNKVFIRAGWSKGRPRRGRLPRQHSDLTLDTNYWRKAKTEFKRVEKTLFEIILITFTYIKYILR